MNKKKSIIVFIFITIALIGLSSISYYFFNENRSSNKTIINTDSNQNENIELSDEDIKRILVKLNEIISFGLNTTSNESIYYLLSGYNLDENKTFIENIEDAKTYTILNGSYTSNKFTLMNDEDYDKMSSEFDDVKFSADSMIDLSFIKKRYYEVFGDNLELKKLKGCPTFEYDDENNKFYSFAGCGGTLFPGVLVYTDSLKKIDTKVEAILYIGTIAPEFKDDTLYYNIYSGTYFHVSDKVSESSYIETIDNDKEIEKYINDNYLKFSKYKMTFVEDKVGNYIYESLKKI